MAQALRAGNAGRSQRKEIIQLELLYEIWVGAG